MTKNEHQKILYEMKQKYDDLVAQEEQKLVEYALEHNLYLSLGDYGSGRSLILEDDHWSGKERGDWVYSSEGC